MTSFVRRLRPIPVVAVFRAATAHRFVEASVALAEAGIAHHEYTLTTSGALRAMQAARAALPAEVSLGAGTVRTVEQAERAIDSGAEFLVSQVCDPSIIEVAKRHDIPFVPGALTPNEVVRAWAEGVEAVKISPVGPLGGPQYIREISAPMPGIALMPTGGVLLEDVPAYLRAGAVAVGVSSWLFRDTLSRDGSMDALRDRAAGVVADVGALDESRLGV